MKINEITDKVIGCAIKVHRKLGPGFLESVYQAALAYELTKIGISFEKEKELPVKYEDIILEIGFRCDFFIESSVIVECKAVKELNQIDHAQLLNYLKITNIICSMEDQDPAKHLSSSIQLSSGPVKKNHGM